MMSEALKNFAQQFAWNPQVAGGEISLDCQRFVVAGMGGSHLGADVLKAREPSLDIIIHCDYGLPALTDRDLQQRLVIASSYSGNTEETIDAFQTALQRRVPVVVIATGGQLIELAKKDRVPYIVLPATGIQPRSALGFSTRALAKVMGQGELLKELSELAELIKPLELAAAGQKLAVRLKNKIPVIYTSTRNQAVGYNWKIKFNETGKIPAFFNILPELNHNEMTGFDVKEPTRLLSQNFYFILLQDSDDEVRIQTRMRILQKLYQERRLSVELMDIAGVNRFHKIFSSLILADWAAFYTAETYGLESEQVPMVEEFKRMIRD